MSAEIIKLYFILSTVCGFAYFVFLTTYISHEKGIYNFNGLKAYYNKAGLVWLFFLGLGFWVFLALMYLGLLLIALIGKVHDFLFVNSQQGEIK